MSEKKVPHDHDMIPCPFCGCKAIDTSEFEGEDFCILECQHCHVTSGFDSRREKFLPGETDIVKAAVRKWNTRWLEQVSMIDETPEAVNKEQLPMITVHAGGDEIHSDRYWYAGKDLHMQATNGRYVVLRGGRVHVFVPDAEDLTEAYFIPEDVPIVVDIEGVPNENSKVGGRRPIEAAETAET